MLVHVLARLARQVVGWLVGWPMSNDSGPGFALERQMMMSNNMTQLHKSYHHQ
jgi:hypothetical protein